MNIKFLRCTTCLYLLMLILLFEGCGGSSGARSANVSGKVTFGGNAVQEGLIYFDPDPVSNKDGIQGFAKIENGNYDTSKTNKGINGGAYRVRITGAIAANGDEPPQVLFRDYIVPIDFPRETTTKDFDIPLSAATRQKINSAEIP